MKNWLKWPRSVQQPKPASTITSDSLFSRLNQQAEQKALNAEKAGFAQAIQENINKPSIGAILQGIQDQVVKDLAGRVKADNEARRTAYKYHQRMMRAAGQHHFSSVEADGKVLVDAVADTAYLESLGWVRSGGRWYEHAGMVVLEQPASRGAFLGVLIAHWTEQGTIDEKTGADVVAVEIDSAQGLGVQMTASAFALRSMNAAKQAKFVPNKVWVMDDSGV